MLLRNTLIFLVFLFIAFFIWLLVGIKFDTFKIADYNVDGLYIKLDKKLILKADNVIIPKSKENTSFHNIPESFERVKYILTFFDSIELKNIIFENNTMSIEYHDDYLRLLSKEYEIIGTVRREGKMIKASIPLLHLNEHNVTIDGKFTYDLHEDILATEGHFIFKDINGEFSASKENSKIVFELKSDTFSELKPIIDKFNLKENVRSWIVDKVEADNYQLLSLTGQGHIKNKKFKMDFEALNGEVLFTDAKIHFKENLAPVLAPSFILTYHHGGLYFDLKEPSYENISLKGSEVKILNLLNTHSNLKLKIRANTRFDSKILHLLKAYNLKIPVNQKSGTVNALFMADLGLKNSYQDFYVNVDFSKGDIGLDKVNLSIEKGNLQYKNGYINLKNIYLKDTRYEGELNGKIDLKKKKSDLILDAKMITLGDEKETFFILKDERLPFVLNYEKGIEIVIPKLYTRLTNVLNETHIYLTDLNKIKPYLLDPEFIEQGGNVDISTTDFKTYSIEGILKRTTCFLYEEDHQCKARVPFWAKVSANDIDFFAFEKRFYYNKAKSQIKLTNLNFDLAKFLETEKKESRKEKANTADTTTQQKSLVFLGTKSHLRYGAYTLVTDSYDVELKPNGDIIAIGSVSNDIIKFSKKKNIFSLHALRIKDKALHPLIDFRGLQDGRYSIKALGDPEKTVKGKIIIEGGVMKDFKAYNNTLAFINTIPALASLQNPGYSVKGFTIEEGVAEYRMIKKDKIIFDSIYIKGTSATIAGTGEIDLVQKTINLDLAIQTARELGKLVGSVPLVGYIITGGDKSMTFGLKITGALDNPKVATSAGDDILALPLKILKRAIESPGYILNK